jgi:1-acyl-sn-glycerol-3-phosphate acyltransferase
VAGVADSLTNRLAWVCLRAVCRAAMRGVDLHVEGLDHLPATGPAIIAARHYHHIHDGAALLTLAPRPLRVLVTLDWVDIPVGQPAMREACRAAGCPVVPRASLLPAPASRSALLAGARESVALLRAGRLLLVFPEGYPTIDPNYTPKTRDDEFLPFRPGFLRFAALAERDGRTRVPIIPTGLEYKRGERWELTVRFGSPVSIGTGSSLSEQGKAIERDVRRLSGHPATT